jgi:hypothetical protein
MKPGTLLAIFADLVALLTAQGFITAAGDFDDTKLNTIEEILSLTSGVEALLAKHGVVVPAKVDAILKILPLLAALAK